MEDDRDELLVVMGERATQLKRAACDEPVNLPYLTEVSSLVRGCNEW